MQSQAEEPRFYLGKQVFQPQMVRESLSDNEDVHLRGGRLKAVTRTRRLFKLLVKYQQL